MLRDFGTIAQNKTEVKEGTILALEGVSSDVSVLVDGSGTLVVSSVILYESQTDVSGTKLTGSNEVKGRVIKTKAWQNLIGGMDYQMIIYFTDGGIATVRTVNIICMKLGVNPSKYQQTDYLKYRIWESPIMIHPGLFFTVNVIVAGYGVIGASPTMYAFKGTTDDSANVLSSATSVTGRTITTKAIGDLAGGSEYLMYLLFTDGGKSTWRYFEVIAPKLGAY